MAVITLPLLVISGVASLVPLLASWDAVMMRLAPNQARVLRQPEVVGFLMLGTVYGVTSSVRATILVVACVAVLFADTPSTKT